MTNSYRSIKKKLINYFTPKICPFLDEPDHCHIFHYHEPIIQEFIIEYMKKKGWEYTGECRRNSGNGSLHIYKRIKK